MVVVDIDYTGQTGYVGSGVSSAYVTSPGAVNSDVNYVRRVSFNVGRVTAVTATGLQLAQALIAGTPTAGMSVQPILGFVDREGSNFFQEWSGLFVIPGEQGDRILLHYPRLQISSSATETVRLLDTPLKKVDTLGRVAQVAQFRALPVTDTNDSAAGRVFPQLYSSRRYQSLVKQRDSRIHRSLLREMLNEGHD